MKIIRLVRLSLSTCLRRNGHQFIRSTSCLSISSARSSSFYSHSIHAARASHFIRLPFSFHSSPYRSTSISSSSLYSYPLRSSFDTSSYHHPSSHRSILKAEMSTDTSSNIFPEREQFTNSSSEHCIRHRNDFLGLDLEAALTAKGQSICCLVMINSGEPRTCPLSVYCV